MIGVLHGNNSKLAKASQISPDPFPSEKPKSSIIENRRINLEVFLLIRKKSHAQLQHQNGVFVCFPLAFFAFLLPLAATERETEETRERSEAKFPNLILSRSPNRHAPECLNIEPKNTIYGILNEFPWMFSWYFLPGTRKRCSALSRVFSPHICDVAELAIVHNKV